VESGERGILTADVARLLDIYDADPEEGQAPPPPPPRRGGNQATHDPQGDLAGTGLRQESSGVVLNHNNFPVRLRHEGTGDVIDFHVDKAGSVPAYAQLVRQVREAMRLGLLRAGDQLPTVREVVTACTINAATVLKAYRELEMSGLVESRQGSGTFVTGTLGSADPHVMARLRTGLAHWLDQARGAGLEDEDVQALVTSVLAQQAADAARAGADGVRSRAAGLGGVA
jgi:GntR family transcriptional regulator